MGTHLSELVKRREEQGAVKNSVMDLWYPYMASVLWEAIGLLDSEQSTYLQGYLVTGPTSSTSLIEQ